ncbi:MSHA fimbrial biogenesis protein MshG [Niveibacterium umoris]|uniref:MSHA biogenesis protein MshG n=1 Tax=Niveibacterium umoris TaxID=1193620 RepID=A0A840BIP3_9RHOO|nr:type II secretion system F family protein [Niveibacterium umoris]MBB4012503.1 MSHA biogenesis protein MshG [Niveibacterium umoris]
MAGYSYRGRDARGVLVEGLLDALNEAAVADNLMSRGITPLDIRVARGRGFSLGRLKLGERKVSDEDIMFFSRQMYTLMKAGVPILQALGGLRESSQVPAFAAVLGKLREGLDSGRELSIALTDTGVFSPFYIAMVKVGEMTGRLDLIFLRLFEHLEFEKEMRQKISAAIRYPSFVIIAMAAAIAVINLFVIPSFAKVFKQFNAELPLITRGLIGFSSFTVEYWWLVLLVCIGAAVGVRFWLKTPAGRLKWDRAKLRMPIVGDTVSKATLARFARAFSLSLTSGLPVTQAFAVVAQVVDNAWIAMKLDTMRQGVERGDSILRTAAASRVFTPMVLQMIQVGEESGDVDGLLMEVAEMYEREVAYEVDNLSARIEPILIVCLAGLVLLLALGVFLPMWDLGSAMMRRQG